MNTMLSRFSNFPRLIFPLVMAACAVLTACGGGSSGSSSGSTGSTSNSSGALANNAAPVTISTAVSGRIPNLPYVSLTLCVPGTNTCQTIDDVLVDTGSVGLRLVASAVSLSLPVQTDNSGKTVAECTQFADGYSWGPLRKADLRIAGEAANNIAINLIGDASIPAAPTLCSGTSLTSDNSVQTVGANGILGIGPLAQDCGAACVTSTMAPYYYSCSSSTCTPTTIAVTKQLQQPVTLFASDNNGSVLILPSVAAAGQPSTTGQLIFGIGTQSNNAVGGATVIKTSSNARMTVVYNGTSLPYSLLDSGSNGIFFTDNSIVSCAQNTVGYPFYCPASSLSLSATVSSPVTSTSTAVSFTINNAATLLSANSGTNEVLPGLGCDCYSSTTYPGFDFGLPFFYGRSVFVAVEGKSTPAGTGPYVAF